jgi:hypothetical protein
MSVIRRMTSARRLLVACVTALCLTAGLATAVLAAAESVVPGDVILLRVFLKDGSTVVSYGEYARVGDDVVLSMPLGKDVSRPTLQLITLPAASVDWPRTERYAASARYQQYIATRAEEDFAEMSAATAASLNEIEASTDRQHAIEIADAARRRLASWPSEHYGYRAADVADIISIIDDAISRIAGAGAGGRPFQVSLVANPVLDSLEPVLGLPAPRDQVRRLAALANASPHSTERVELMRAALRLMDDPSSEINREESADLRRTLEERIRDEVATDDSYARMTTKLLGVAQRAAARAQVYEVQRVIESVSDEDARLGSRRPETTRALRAELMATLDAARDLRLRRDQWALRRDLYRTYVERVSTTVAQLVKAQSALEAIRSLAGPSPLRLQTLQRSLAGGMDRLKPIVPPEQLRSAHDQLLAAWQFAVSATDARLKAVESGDLQVAWQASSAAAGSLMLLNRAQDEIRQALTPPSFK